MGTTIDSDVRGLVDRAAIYNLLCQYCDALDFRKWEMLEDVFVPTVLTHWPTGTDEQALAETDVQGSREVIDWLRQVFEDFGPTHHLVSNLVLDVEDDLRRLCAACGPITRQKVDPYLKSPSPGSQVRRAARRTDGA